MGKAPELDNFFVATGFLYGIAAGGGAGKMMAEWILDGRPSLDLWPLDIRRFAFHHTTQTLHVPAGGRAVRPPLQADRARRRTRSGSRRSAQSAARHVEVAWRCIWITRRLGTAELVRAARHRADRSPSFTKPNWFDSVGAERAAVRDGVALIDQTSFAKFEISGPGALAAVQWLSVANMDKSDRHGHVHPAVQRAWRHRVRPHDDPHRA